MPAELLTTLLLYIITIGFSPGPANIFSLSCAMRYGKRPALRMWYGLATGFTIVALTITLLSYYVGDTLKEHVDWVRYVGGAYILWIAYNMLRSSGEVKENDRSCSFWSGVLVQLTNAKMIVFTFTLFGIFVVPYTKSLTDYFAFMLFAYIPGPVANLTWLVAGVYLRRLFTNHRRAVDIVMALALCICAFVIIFG